MLLLADMFIDHEKYLCGDMKCNCLTFVDIPSVDRVTKLSNTISKLLLSIYQDLDKSTAILHFTRAKNVCWNDHAGSIANVMSICIRGPTSVTFFTR